MFVPSVSLGPSYPNPHVLDPCVIVKPPPPGKPHFSEVRPAEHCTERVTAEAPEAMTEPTMGNSSPKKRIGMVGLDFEFGGEDEVVARVGEGSKLARRRARRGPRGSVIMVRR